MNVDIFVLAIVFVNEYLRESERRRERKKESNCIQNVTFSK